MQEKTLCSALPTSSSGHIAAIFDKLVPLLIRRPVFWRAGGWLLSWSAVFVSRALVGAVGHTSATVRLARAR